MRRRITDSISENLTDSDLGSSETDWTHFLNQINLELGIIKPEQNTFDSPDNYTWLQRALAITKAHLWWCYRARRKSNLVLKVDEAVTCRWNFWIPQWNQSYWFITWYIFTDIISDYFTDSGLESRKSIILPFSVIIFSYDLMIRVFLSPQEKVRIRG